VPFAAGGVSGESAAGAALDAAQALDVDVEQLTRPLALVAHSGLEAKASELAHPGPGQDSRHGRERHVQALGDLRASEPHPT
jgi:hypothetical protein